MNKSYAPSLSKSNNNNNNNNNIIKKDNLNFQKDVSIYGVINILLYFVLLFCIETLLRYKNNMFKGFNIYHYMIWYGIIISQTIYFILILAKPQKFINSRFEKVVYNFFTIGGFKSFKDGFILTEKEPLFEYIFLFVFILIPFPIFKTITFKTRLVLLLSKVGLFHVISTLLLMNWKTENVELNYNYD